MNSKPSSHARDNEHKLIFDPVPYSGGSKTAVQEMLSLCQTSNVRFTVFTNDPNSWTPASQSNTHSVRKFSLNKKIQIQTNGLGYWYKQLHLFFILCLELIKLRIKGKKISSLIGISGPGVDFSLYLAKLIFRYEVIQLIQGPVAPSRTIGYCLTKADSVFYLRGVKRSILKALERYFSFHLQQNAATEIALFHLTTFNFYVFDNGLTPQRWPTPCDYSCTQVFWAASLLKWKGLQTLTNAINLTEKVISLPFHICYIKPENTSADINTPPNNSSNIYCYEKPKNLDEIRSRCSIFISTSQNEPFGLSILENLAAGLCVIIPDDNSYWAKRLEDRQTCLKYTPNDPRSLAEAIETLAFEPAMIESIGKAGQVIAQHYQASVCYREVSDILSSLPMPDNASTFGGVLHE